MPSPHTPRGHDDAAGVAVDVVAEAGDFTPTASTLNSRLLLVLA